MNLSDLGLGKSVIGLGAMDPPCLVMCPTSAIQVWEIEAERANIKTQVLRGKTSSSKDIDRTVDLYITTYGSSDAWMGYFRELGSGPDLHTILADEGHYMQRRKLTWTQAFNAVPRERTIVLSATIIRNRLKSLWSPLCAIAPGAWGNSLEFRTRYCGSTHGPYGWVDGKASNVEELAARLSEVAIRETWNSPELAALRPEIRRTRLPITLEPCHLQRLIGESADEVLDVFTGDGTLSGAQLRQLTVERRRIGHAKGDWAIQSGYVGDACENHRRNIWWCWHKEVAREISGYLQAHYRWGDIPVDLVTGDAPSSKRKRILEEWQFGDPSRARHLVATLGAMGQSVNLTTADAAHFIEIDWAPLTTGQAEARHWRFGNKNDQVFSTYLTIPGTVDDRISQVLLEKLEESDLVLDGMDRAKSLERAILDSEQDDLALLREAGTRELK
jgi:hypothetical protein